MLKCVRDLWTDQRGFIVSIEMILIVTIGVLGLIVGLSCLANAVNAELQDIGWAVRSLNQSYWFGGFRGCKAFVSGSGFMNRRFGFWGNNFWGGQFGIGGFGGGYGYGNGYGYGGGAYFNDVDMGLGPWGYGIAPGVISPGGVGGYVAPGGTGGYVAPAQPCLDCPTTGPALTPPSTIDAPCPNGDCPPGTVSPGPDAPVIPIPGDATHPPPVPAPAAENPVPDPTVPNNQPQPVPRKAPK